jgi:hypothetical protein
MNRLIHRWIFFSVVLFFVSLSFVKHKPLWIDQFYVSAIYPYISTLNQWLWGRFSFSVGDVGYCIVILFGMWSLRQFSLKHHFWKTISIIGLVAVLFYISWGLNYFQTSIRMQRQLTDTISEAQLLKTTTHYAQKLTELHNELSSEPDSKVAIHLSKKDILQLATQTMNASAMRPSNIKGKAKATLFPTLLSYMGFGGYANPFTHEAQVNTLQPKLNIITTACHEIAHQWGFAAEDETNYVSIKVSTSSENPLVAYAGTMLAFQYLTNVLYRHDTSLAQEQYKSVPKGVIAHFKEVRNFWQGYQNPFEQIFEKSYDQYLKANQQQAGVKSYSLVVDLLVDDVVNPKQ